MESLSAQGKTNRRPSAQQPLVTQGNELTQKLKAIYRVQDTLPKFIEDASIPEQKMDEYYVALQMIMENRGEKQDIKVGQMFDEIKEGDKTIAELANKVLIIGRAGVGKATFLHHVSYEWGKDNIYGDKFDYVFKVKLKKLASADVSAALNSLNKKDKEDELAKLMALSLEDQQGELREKFRDSNPIEKEQIVSSVGMDIEEYGNLLKVKVSPEEIESVLVANESKYYCYLMVMMK